MKKVTLEDVLELLDAFAQADPEDTDWAIIGDVVDEYLDYKESVDEYLTNEEYDDYIHEDDRY